MQHFLNTGLNDYVSLLLLTARNFKFILGCPSNFVIYQHTLKFSKFFRRFFAFRLPWGWEGHAANQTRSHENKYLQKLLKRKTFSSLVDPLISKSTQGVFRSVLHWLRTWKLEKAQERMIIVDFFPTVYLMFRLSNSFIRDSMTFQRFGNLFPHF